MKMHFVQDGSHDGYEASTACGLEGWRNDGTSQWYTKRDTDQMFSAAYEAETVTCKRCLSKMDSPLSKTNVVGSLTPNKPGAYWAVLDDGNGETKAVLLHVYFFFGEKSFNLGAVCEFVDGSGWGFEADSFEDGLIVRPLRVSPAASQAAPFRSEVKVYWHGEAMPPASIEHLFQS
jgi:hypothetical protein